MSLPPLFPFTNNLDIPFLKTDGVTNPDETIIEPGCFFDTSINDVGTAHYPQVVQVTDYELTGTFASSATWTVTVTMLTTQSGTSAAAHAMAPASTSFVATADTAADTVLGLIEAINAAITTIAGAYTGGNIASYVVASVGASAAKLRLTARVPGATFSAVITSTVGGDGYTATSIASPVTDTIKVGLFYGIDTSKGTAGYDKEGRPYFTKITSSMSAATFRGPIFRGSDTQPVEPGFAYREYKSGQNIPYAKYGHISAYGEKAITLSNGPEAVYVRHTDAGDYLAGMVTDAAGAAVGATANLWTGTPTAVDATDYAFQVSVVNNLGVTVTEHVGFTSGAGTTATLIVTGLKAALALKPTLTGLVAGGGTSTITLTGPADGRAVTVTNLGPGTIAFVETNPEVSTHTRTTRGEMFIAPSTHIGRARIAVPVTPNV
jgi:hypothetical protein